MVFLFPTPCSGDTCEGWLLLMYSSVQHTKHLCVSFLWSVMETGAQFYNTMHTSAWKPEGCHTKVGDDNTYFPFLKWSLRSAFLIYLPYKIVLRLLTQACESVIQVMTWEGIHRTGCYMQRPVWRQQQVQMDSPHSVPHGHSYLICDGSSLMNHLCMGLKCVWERGGREWCLTKSNV